MTDPKPSSELNKTKNRPLDYLVAIIVAGTLFWASIPAINGIMEESHTKPKVDYQNLIDN